MKPIKLLISAFGPFAEEIEVDFSRYERDGLFLLSGETGAGKTTIFDAISFALFGKVSGGTRGTDNLRSDFARPETATFVELEFEHKGAIYRVRRSPEYTRLKARGEGVTTAVAAVEFHSPERETALTKTREVDAAIEELLSVMYDQFKQVMMIAQGEFLSLITAESKDRTEIMRRVFSTGLFSDLQTRLQKLAGELRSEKDGIAANVTRLQNSFITDVDFSEKRLTALSKRRRDVKTELDALHIKIEQASLLNTTLRTLHDNRTKLAETRESERTAKTILEKVSADEPHREQLKRDIEEIKAALPKYVEYTAKTKAFGENGGRLSKGILEHDELAARLESNKAELSELKAESETLKNAETDAVVAKNALEIAEKRAKQLGDLKSAQQSWEKKNSAYIKAQESFLLAKKLYDDSIAGRLAEELRDGKPCPVCGSTTHPHKAQSHHGAPTQVEYEKIERDYNTTRDDSRALKIRRDSLCAELDVVIESIDACIIAQAESVVECSRKKQAADSEVARLNAAREREKRLAAGIETDTEREKNLVAVISALKTDVEVLKTEIANLKKGLKHDTEELANEAHEDLAASLSASQNALEMATEEYQKKREQIASLVALTESGDKTAKELADKLAVPRKVIDLRELVAKKTALTTDSEELEQAEHTAKSAKKQNEKIAAQLAEGLASLQEAEKQYGDMDLLSRTANGGLAGKDKLQFETYVQQVYFDMVLAEANKRFDIMTDGRYELQRQGSGGIQGKTGLNIDVLDSWTQKTRPARTLSGGESFKAALALALGLSDVVQSYSGGIKIDAMFIDEGFGSLDNDSLDSAMDVIASLADGSRLVGIISHVDALKERIPNKILVERDKTGSRVIQSGFEG